MDNIVKQQVDRDNFFPPFKFVFSVWDVDFRSIVENSIIFQFKFAYFLALRTPSSPNVLNSYFSVKINIGRQDLGNRVVKGTTDHFYNIRGPPRNSRSINS